MTGVCGCLCDNSNNPVRTLQTAHILTAVTFEDRISLRGPFPDLAPLRAQYVLLCAQLLAAIAHPKAALALARQLQRHVRVMVQASQQHFRQRQKAAMLWHPAWREQVIRGLGGWKRLKRWTSRQAAIEAASLGQGREKLYETAIHPVSDDDEVQRRIWMRELMRANIHPRILRDPCRMDFDGWFRLPPQKRLTNPIADPDYEYDFDPRPIADFSGVKAPILIWPEEFKAAAELRPVGKEEEEGKTCNLFVTPVPDPGALRMQDRRYRRGLILSLFAQNDNIPPAEMTRIPTHIRESKDRDDKAKGYSSRAPPCIRGSPNNTLRQALLAERFSMFIKHSA